MRVLITDDEPMNLRVLTGMLKGIAECETMPGGKETLEAFERSLRSNEPYDLILLDIMMPEMDGHECLEAIRKLEQQYQVKPGAEVMVVMVSALCDQQNVCKAFFRGHATSYLTKPVDKSDLLKLVNGPRP
jgi:two-component system chemotaxis response regulator CheY